MIKHMFYLFFSENIFFFGSRKVFEMLEEGRLCGTTRKSETREGS